MRQPPMAQTFALDLKSLIKRQMITHSHCILLAVEIMYWWREGDPNT